MAISVGVLVSPKLNSFHLLHAHRWTAIPYIHHLLRRRRRRQRSCRRRVSAVYHHLNVADAYVRLSAYWCCCWLFSGDCFFFCWFATLAEDEKRSYSRTESRDWWYFRIYKDAVWQCHGINRELVFGGKTSALLTFRLVRSVSLVFWTFIVWCARVYRDKYITRTKRALDVGSKFWSPKDYIEDFCGLFKAIFNTTWTNSVW